MADSKSPSADAEARDFLYGRIDFERSPPAGTAAFKLPRMRRLLDRLGNPQDGQRIIHIAGTKGKGSTAAMIASILAQSGIRTGIYTSPHLDTVEERLAIDGAACSPGEFAALIGQVRAIVEPMDDEARRTGDPAGGPTFFEILTAAAFLYFAQQACGATVLEVGLGGRLDSTNICLPEVSVITTISFDHTKQLGNTLAAIAAEKAGIIKLKTPVVCGVRASEPLDVIRRVAAELDAPLFRLGDDFEFACLPESASSPIAADASDVETAANSADKGRSFAQDKRPQVAIRSRGTTLHYRDRLDAQDFRLDDLRLSLRGEHQALNASVALATVRTLALSGWNIPVSACREGLWRARCPARVEVVADRPTVILDAAHNVASAEALAAVLRRDFPARPRTLVFAVSRDKDVAGMLRVLLPEFDRIIVTEYRNNPRAMPIDELSRIAHAIQAETRSTATVALSAVDEPQSAWREARRVATPDDVLCVAGSFFLAAELRSLASRGES